MEKRPMSDFMDTTLHKVREMIDANTIIGEPITTPDGISLIPISKVSFGFAGGGAGPNEKKPDKDGFGGGFGGGVKIEPVAFIVAKSDGTVKMLYVTPPMDTPMDKFLDAVPDFIDRVADVFNKDKDKDKDNAE